MDKINLFLIAHAGSPGSFTLGPVPGTAESNARPIGLLLGDWFVYLIYAAVILAVIMITIGGVEYIISIVPGKKEQGKKRIWNAIYGLILLFAAYMILRTINPALVENLKFPELK